MPHTDKGGGIPLSRYSDRAAPDPEDEDVPETPTVERETEHREALAEAFQQIREEKGEFPKEAADYKSESPVPGSKCGSCRFYEGEEGERGPCQLVQGEVEAGGVCQLWMNDPGGSVEEDDSASEEDEDGGAILLKFMDR